MIVDYRIQLKMQTADDDVATIQSTQTDFEKQKNLGHRDDSCSTNMVKSVL